MRVLYHGPNGIYSDDFVGGKTEEAREKPSEQGKNQKQIQPTNDTGPELNPVQVGGKRSHYCAIPLIPNPLLPAHSDKSGRKI